MQEIRDQAKKKVTEWYAIQHPQKVTELYAILYNIKMTERKVEFVFLHPHQRGTYTYLKLGDSHVYNKWPW